MNTRTYMASVAAAALLAVPTFAAAEGQSATGQQDTGTQAESQAQGEQDRATESERERRQGDDIQDDVRESDTYGDETGAQTGTGAGTGAAGTDAQTGTGTAGDQTGTAGTGATGTGTAGTGATGAETGTAAGTAADRERDAEGRIPDRAEESELERRQGDDIQGDVREPETYGQDDVDVEIRRDDAEAGVRDDVARDDTAATEPRTDVPMEGGFVTAPSPDAIDVDDMAGYSVVGAQGEQIGTVDRVVINRQGEVEALVISSGGFLGMGEQTYAVDWDAVDVDVQQQEIRTQLTEQQIEGAPGYDDERADTGLQQ